MFRKTLTFISLLILPIYTYSFVVQMRQVPFPPAGNTFWFLIGAIVMGLYYALWGARSFRMAALHELNHAIMGWLWGADVKSLGASGRMGGMVQYGNREVFGHELVTIAPYFFQPVTLSLAAVRLMVRPEFDPWICAPMGAMLVMFYWDLAMTITTSDRTQDDIEKVGKRFASLTIIAMNLLITGAILCAVAPETSVQGFLWHGPGILYHTITTWFGQM